jgi:hypothetical protein
LVLKCTPARWIAIAGDRGFIARTDEDGVRSAGVEDLEGFEEEKEPRDRGRECDNLHLLRVVQSFTCLSNSELYLFPVRFCRFR